MRKLILLSFAIGFVMSCEKNDPVAEQSAGFLPLQIGNYWIYQHVDIDSLHNETFRDYTDSVSISRDTLINGNQYFILEGTNYPASRGQWEILDILRDSMGYIINQKGIIRFAENNFTDILASKTEVHQEDTLFILNYKMESMENSCQVPAGQYEVLNYKGTVSYHVDIPGIQNPRYLNTYYADGVGKVLQSYFYFSSPVISEKRLLRYKIVSQ